MPLRCFFIQHTPTAGRPRKMQHDFPDGTNEAVARENIHARYGQRDTKSISCTQEFAEIVGFKQVSAEPARGEVECFKATEDALFTPQMLRETVSYAPTYKGKR